MFTEMDAKIYIEEPEIVPECNPYGFDGLYIVCDIRLEDVLTDALDDLESKEFIYRLRRYINLLGISDDSLDRVINAVSNKLPLAIEDYSAYYTLRSNKKELEEYIEKIS
jgi:hypothetical protein